MHALLLNQYYHPDVAPTAQLAADLGASLVEAGHRVTAIASCRPYSLRAAAALGLPARLSPREVHAGVDIRRVSATAFGRAAIAGRAADYASFLALAAPSLLAAARPDVIVALTTPPLLAALAALAAPLRRARLVLWVMDVYPEAAFALGALPSHGLAAAALRAAARALYARADAIVALDDAMRDRLVEAGAPPGRVTVIDNWPTGPDLRPAPIEGNALRAALGLAPGDFTVSYSGNLGNGHDIDTLLAAMRALASEPVTWLLIGDGPARARVESAVRDHHLARVRLLDYLPAAELPTSLTAAHASIVTLKPHLAGLLAPSKLYGLLAAGVPVLHVGPTQGRTYELVTHDGVGVHVDNGDVDGLVSAVRALRDDPDSRVAMGRRARAVFEARFDRPIALQRHHALLRRIVNPDGAAC